MDLIINNLKIPIENDGLNQYHKAAAQKLGLSQKEISLGKILSKAINLHDPDQFYYNISVVVCVNEKYPNVQKFSEYTDHKSERRTITKPKDRPIIIGFGPAGIFAAIELIALGIKPIIFERGKIIEERIGDVQQFINTRQLNSESNIQFGEGGAGSFSDGKLFSRRNNNTSYINRVLKTFIKFGAPAEIEYISKPHLGTDVLRRIVRNMRFHILEHGGEIHYNSKMTDLMISGGKAIGIVINGCQEYYSTKVYLALGHSARSTMEMLHGKGVVLQQRPISIGVRVEHPVETINLMRYGEKYQNFPGLGAATYSLNYTDRKIKRGVYTFCMCPGGEIVNASSSDGMLVVNGMSYSHRSAPYSNGALVVSCHVSDYPSSDPLAGLEFQKEIERKAFKAGGGHWRAPAQNLLNFLGQSNTTEPNENSYKMGVTPTDLNDVFPAMITTQLRTAFCKWASEVPLFISEQAILIGCETRTSSAVRIVRDENFESVNIENLFPIGEGSGYTGGITSSAADAIKAVERHFVDKGEAGNLS